MAQISDTTKSIANEAADHLVIVLSALNDRVDVEYDYEQLEAVAEEIIVQQHIAESRGGTTPEHAAYITGVMWKKAIDFLIREVTLVTLS